MDAAGKSEYDRVMDFVMTEVVKNPKTNNEELRRRAADISPSVMELGVRQFQGKYRLPAIRRLRKEGRIPPAPPRPVTNGRRKRKKTPVAAPRPITPPSPLAPAMPSMPGQVGRRPRGGAAAPRLEHSTAEVAVEPVVSFNRDVARTELLKFAMAVAAAQDQQTTLATVAKIDEYLDRIAEASGK